VAHASRWISQVAHGAFLLCQVERARPGRHRRSGAGLKKTVGEARAKQGRKATTSFLIVDAQRVKNTDSAEQKGYDAGKKVSGIKRHIGVDTQGLPMPSRLPLPR
jgi:Transposase DDE domain